MAQGRNNAGIAQALFLSERAVEKHINSLFSKLGLSEEPDVHRRVKAVLLYPRRSKPEGERALRDVGGWHPGPQPGRAATMERDGRHRRARRKTVVGV